MALSLKQSIDVNAALLVQGGQAIDDESTRAQAAEFQLASDLSAEVTDRVNALQVESSTRFDEILVETNRALAAEGFISAAVDALELSAAGLVSDEAVARDAAIAVADARAVAAEGLLATSVSDEVADRIASVSAEAALRVAGAADDAAARVVLESKQCFAHTMEYQGILEPGSTPFAMGYGVPSKPGFGVYIPKGFIVKSWVIQSNSSDVGGVAELQIVHYPYNSLQGTVIDTRIFDGSFTSSTFPDPSPALDAGSLVIHIGGPQTLVNLVDVDARYRVTLYCQMTEAL